ncbi:MAG: hypothetical protein IAF58_05475, partial [Leptolyngbya sp.]|nr:hypothetical protein [Candidatus Melainabacteria bacterium]
MCSNDHSLPEGLSLRHCRLDDLNGIVRIVNSKNNRLSFGWVQKVVLADAVNHQDLDGEESQHLICVVVNEEGKI